MENKEFFEKVDHYGKKLDFVLSLKGLKELEVSYDRLSSEKAVDQELLYFKKGDEKERKGLFIFSYDYFIKELNDQEFKKVLGLNMLNLIIMDAYTKVRKSKKARINDILNRISEDYKEVRYISRNKILKRILTLAYYHNWNLEKAKEGIDPDFLIEIPEDFGRLKQRFNLDMTLPILDNSEYMFFLNAKGDLCLVFKKLSKISKKDVEKSFDMIKKELNIKNVSFVK